MIGVGLLVAVLALVACTDLSKRPISCDFTPTGAPSDVTMKVAARFEVDAGFRRQCLEASLVNKHNGYAKTRLKHYTEGDWGHLPIAAFQSRPVRPSDLGRPIPTVDATWSQVPVGPFDDSIEGLRRRGEQMFTRFPAQLERSMIPILRDKEAPTRYGLWQTEDSVGGLVWVQLKGGVFPSLTCSSCHASVDRSGRLRPGVQNHQFDLGKAKDAPMHALSLYSTWGPGRVDISADGRDNPIAIADVRAIRFQTHLHRTANVKNSLVMLALRIETGLITAHRGAVRPTPKDAFALAYYLWSLGAEFNLETPMHHPGRATFSKYCASCHIGLGHSGLPVTPEAIHSPVAMKPSPDRGTGTVQTPSLLGVSSRRRLLFGGEADSVGALLDPNRTEGGHYVGRQLSEDERRTIEAYLQSL